MSGTQEGPCMRARESWPALPTRASAPRRADARPVGRETGFSAGQEVAQAVPRGSHTRACANSSSLSCESGRVGNHMLFQYATNLVRVRWGMRLSMTALCTMVCGSAMFVTGKTSTSCDNIERTSDIPGTYTLPRDLNKTPPGTYPLPWRLFKKPPGSYPLPRCLCKKGCRMVCGMWHSICDVWHVTCGI